MGLGINWTGAAAGYNAYRDEQRRQEDTERRRVEDEARKSDRAYQDEVRSRQRYEWSEADRIRNQNKASNAQYVRDHRMPGDPEDPAPATAPATAPDPATGAPSAAAPDDGGPQTQPVADPAAGITPLPATDTGTQAPPLDASLAGAPVADMAAAPTPMPTSAAAPVPAPAPAGQGAPANPGQAAAPALPAQGPANPVPTAAAPPAALVAPAGGIPKPRQMGSILGMYENMLEAAAKNGDVNPQAYLQTRELLNKMRTEGVTQGLEAMARGDFAGAVALNNSMGTNQISIVPGSIQQTTTTLPTGQVVPTYKLRVVNSDGSRADIDTALNQFQTLKLTERLELMDKTAQHTSDAAYKTGMVEAAKKNADTQEKWRGDQARNAEDANLVRMMTGGARGANNAAKLDDKAFKQALDLNEHLYSYVGEDGKDIQVAPAKSLYGNMLLRLGDDKAYHVMAELRAEAVKNATDPKTHVMDQAAFLKYFNTSIAAADARMRKGAATSATATAPAKAPQPKAQPSVVQKPAAAPAAAPSDDAMMENWVDQKLMGPFDGPSKYREIARTNPNPAIRSAAQRLYDKANATAAQDQPGADRAL